MRTVLPQPLRVPARTLVAAACAGLLLSCAAPDGFVPDPQAAAPVLEGYGRIDSGLRTQSPEAKRLFEAAMLQAYAFNEAAAVRTFRAALAKDPGCAMCAWGVAWQLGPNINDTDRDKVAEAVRYVDYALQRLHGASERDRALVEALALRYAHASQLRETAPLMAERCGKPAGQGGGVHPLDQAYADRMRTLADRYPLDPDVQSLYAEAELVATPGDHLYDDDGKPAGRVGELADRLEKLLPAFPDHTGVNHYMVHAADAPSAARRATVAADRLARLAPASPHLLHMPGHIYVWTGRFEDAVALNQRAVAADLARAAQEHAQGFAPTKDWRAHNTHFLWFAAVMSGQESAALDAARQLGELVAGRKDAFGDFIRSMPMQTLLRFERWEQALAVPAPEEGAGPVGRLFWEHGRGVAQARLGRSADALASLAQLRASVAAIRGDQPQQVPHRRLAMADYALARLEAELALAAGDTAAAVAHQQQAVRAADVLDRSEPPWLANWSIVTLGEMQAQGRQWKEAEATFQRSLAQRPNNFWARRGLERVRSGQGRA